MADLNKLLSEIRRVLDDGPIADGQTVRVSLTTLDSSATEQPNGRDRCEAYRDAYVGGLGAAWMADNQPAPARASPAQAYEQMTADMANAWRA